MNRQSRYNSLSVDLQKLHSVIYSETRSADIHTFKSANEKWGAITSKGEVLVPAKFDSIYHNAPLNLLECVTYNHTENREDKTFTYFSATGKLLWNLIGYSRATVDDYGNLIVTRNNLKTILGENSEELFEPCFEQIQPVSPELFKAKRGEKWGIINKAGNILHDFVFNAIYGSFESQFLLVESDGGIFKLDKDCSTRTKLPYSHLLRASSSSYWWKPTMDADKMKVIFNGQFKSDVLETEILGEMVQYTGKWGVIRKSGEELIKPVYDYIDFFGLSDHYLVMVGERNAVMDEYGTFILNEMKCGVINAAGTIVVPIEYDWLMEISENLWAVNSGGTVCFDNRFQEETWIVKGGKWGVINNASQIIVPVAYDCLMLNWYRIKDLIFVQNNSETFNGNLEYEVYDSDGRKLTGVLPDYRNHIFYNA